MLPAEHSQAIHHSMCRYSLFIKAVVHGIAYHSTAAGSTQEFGNCPIGSYSSFRDKTTNRINTAVEITQSSSGYK